MLSEDCDFHELSGQVYPPYNNDRVPISEMFPWQPSSWPNFSVSNNQFLKIFEEIIHKSILNEINNVINDIQYSNETLEHRGHVVAISLLCALDAISAYGYKTIKSEYKKSWKDKFCKLCGCSQYKSSKGKHIKQFVRNHFPEPYPRYDKRIYTLYRNSLIHSWNLFKANISPDNQSIHEDEHGILSFGLLDFFESFKKAVDDFLKKLKHDKKLQENALKQYNKLRE